jgi:hypothetical protein
VAIKPQRGAREKGRSETANQEARRVQKSKSELIESLDFLVTFLAMKKVT